MIALFIKKTTDKLSSSPLAKAFLNKEKTTVNGNAAEPPRKFNTASMMPGVVMDQLQEGEEPVTFNHSQASDPNYGAFESAIVQGLAWANEIPPEILQLAFSNNYSASQAAINEFKIYLNKERTKFGDEVCQPIYIEWLLSESLLRKITTPGLLVSWRDPSKYDIFNAWLLCDWSGAIKPSTDIKKQAQGYELLLKNGLVTRRRSARELTGTKYSKNVELLKIENQKLADALTPLLELEQKFGTDKVGEAIKEIDDKIEDSSAGKEET